MNDFNELVKALKDEALAQSFGTDQLTHSWPSLGQIAEKIEKAVKGKVLVDLKALEYLSTFSCEHGKPLCKDANRGALCNSCFVVAFAEKHLPSPDKPKVMEKPPEGSGDFEGGD